MARPGCWASSLITVTRMDDADSIETYEDELLVLINRMRKDIPVHLIIWLLQQVKANLEMVEIAERELG